MYSSKPVSNRLRNTLFLAVVIALTLAAIFAVTRLPGAAWTSQAAAAPVINRAASVPQPSHRVLDLGAGYVLDSDALGSRIVPPPNSVRVSAQVKTIDLGDGYSLKIDAQGGQIISPQSSLRVPAPSRSVDLGDGYTLKLDAQGGQIVAPASQVKSQTSAMRKVDIGGGYWLVTGPDGGQIVREGSR